jgi:hypothetical protein
MLMRKCRHATDGVPGRSAWTAALGWRRLTMADQKTRINVEERIRGVAAEMRIPGDHLLGVPQELAEAVTAAGLQASTGTVAFAGQYASGGFAVQYNDQNGGFSSVWPQWAFDLAKAALLGGRRVWVASNGETSHLGHRLLGIDR